MSISDRYSDKLCAQRKPNGDPCKSPALRDKLFCHFHEVMGPPQIDIDNGEGIPSRHVYLPVLKDAASIQLAISEICEMVLHRRIEPKEAGTLFYAMQVASSNLGHLNGKKGQDRSRKEKHDNSAESSSSTPASPEAVSTAQDDSKSASSAEPDRLPPGTIQACEPPRRFVV